MSELYKFTDFELDGARFELRRAGRAVTVQPKVLRMLLLLVRERERVVSTEELYRALWPGERVGPSSIRRAVRGLRQALGESAESQQSVRTVRGFGYQFRLPVQLGSAGAPAVPQSLPTGSWEADLTTLRSADTLPLFGGPAKLLRDQALQAWQRSRSTNC